MRPELVEGDVGRSLMDGVAWHVQGLQLGSDGVRTEPKVTHGLAADVTSHRPPIAGERHLRLVVTAPDTDDATLAEAIGAIHEVPVATGAGAGSPRRA